MAKQIWATSLRPNCCDMLHGVTSSSALSVKKFKALRRTFGKKMRINPIYDDRYYNVILEVGNVTGLCNQMDDWAW